MLLALLLAAAPVLLPAPSVQEVGGCAPAACTGDHELRVCKCLPVQAGLEPGITVDRRPAAGAPERHVEWDVRTWRGAVDDFSVTRVDLDGDGLTELVIANLAVDGPTRTFELAIVDGAAERVTHARAQDFGPDAVGARTVLFTEWDGASFVGREFSFSRGKLVPTSAPVLRRAPSAAFDRVRAERPLAPRAWLATGATRGVDDVPRGLRTVPLLGLTRDDGVLGLHLELPGGALVSLSGELGAQAPLRLGQAQQRRLYPPGYAPPDAEEWLSGRSISVVVDREQPTGQVWLDEADATARAKPRAPGGAAP